MERAQEIRVERTTCHGIIFKISPRLRSIPKLRRENDIQLPLFPNPQRLLSMGNVVYCMPSQAAHSGSAGATRMTSPFSVPPCSVLRWSVIGGNPDIKSLVQLNVLERQGIVDHKALMQLMRWCVTIDIAGPMTLVQLSVL